MIRTFIVRIALTWVLAICALSAVSMTAHAAAGGLVTPAILGGLNQTVSTGGSTGYTAGARLGFGLAILEADVGAMYLSRAFSGIDNINFIQIPAMIRYSLIPMLSIGGGGYYDIAITSNAPSAYGIRGALMVSVPAFPLFAEANYSHGLGTTGTTTDNVNDVQLLVGFKF
jgi:hypothetical protein